MRDFAAYGVSCADDAPGGATTLSDDRRLNELARFLADVERRALRIAQIGVRSHDDALDIVQDAMIRLARRYGDRPPGEWTPLFYRILHNRVRDWHRRQGVRRRILAFAPSAAPGEDEPDPVADAADPQGRPPEALLAAEQAMRGLEQALCRLPERQREAFVLRALEGLDTADTAKAMRVSEGSVKTHYFRALRALRDMLGDHWP